MLLRIAWRNIWRNTRRSIIVLTSIAVGVVAIVLNDGLSVGMISQIFENQIGSFVSNIQIHEKGFNDNKIIQKLVPHPDRVEEILRHSPEVTWFSRRVVTFGLLSSALNSSGVTLVGVEHERESKVSTVRSQTTVGRYLSGEKHEIVIGKRLAEKLNVGLGDKVVAMASTRNGNVGADMFRIVGLFETVSAEFDKSFIFISLANAQEMLELNDGVSEFAVITKNRNGVEPVKRTMARKLGPDYEVLSYADLLPLMLAQMEIYKESIYIVFIIVGLAMIFGIVNTMTMSVFERIREFGVLMAIGMKNSRVIGMILLEALLLGVLGTMIGIVAASAITLPLSVSGLDLSRFSEGLTAFGSGSIIYPVLSVASLIESLCVIPLIAVLGAMYPALKAARFEPVGAIRYV
jgi:ABC-type lipoprotein release transport system permease subunit